MSLARNIAITFTARLAVMALALVSSVVLARMLGPEGRGLFALVLLLPEWARSFGLLGFEQANAVYAGLEADRRRALVWQSVALAGAVGSVVGLGAACFFVFGGPGTKALIHGPLWLYVLPLCTLPGRLVVEYWSAILRGMNHIVLLNVVDVGTKLFSLALVVVFVVGLQLQVIGAVWADTIVSLAGVLLLAALLKSVGVWGRPIFDRSLWRRTARFAIPAHCGSIAAYLNYRIDELFVAAMLPPEQLGLYVIAVALVERLWILPGAIGNALLPHLANSPKRDAALSAVISRHVILLTGAACLLLFCLADVIVRAMYSSAFAEAAGPLRWLLPGVFSLSVGKVLVAELLAQEKPRYTVWASSIAAIVNVIGNLLLVPRMGISGAALTSSISYSLLSFMLIRYYLRETRMSWTVLLPCPNDIVTYAALCHAASSGILRRLQYARQFKGRSAEV